MTLWAAPSPNTASRPANHGVETGHESAKDDTRDEGVNIKDPKKGDEAKHGNKAGRTGADDGNRDKGVNGEDHAGGIEAEHGCDQVEHDGDGQEINAAGETASFFFSSTPAEPSSLALGATSAMLHGM